MEVLRVTWNTFKDLYNSSKYCLSYYIQNDFIIIISYLISDNGSVIFYRACIFNDILNSDYQDFMNNYLGNAIKSNSLDESLFYLKAIIGSPVPYIRTLNILKDEDVNIFSNKKIISWFNGDYIDLYTGFYVEIYGINGYDAGDHSDIQFGSSVEAGSIDVDIHGKDDFGEYKVVENVFPSLYNIGEKVSIVYPNEVMVIKGNWNDFPFASISDKIINREEGVSNFYAARVSFIKDREISKEPSTWYWLYWEYIP